mmetsp:Transcript_27904/g.75197  ORF Transcript_27904/g.75197 Transcript_27904/m.75197 type:complete len:211 (+) Transcript_27904:3474-4106(+)
MGRAPVVRAAPGTAAPPRPLESPDTLRGPREEEAAPPAPGTQPRVPTWAMGGTVEAQFLSRCGAVPSATAPMLRSRAPGRLRKRTSGAPGDEARTACTTSRRYTSSSARRLAMSSSSKRPKKYFWGVNCTPGSLRSWCRRSNSEKRRQATCSVPSESTVHTSYCVKRPCPGFWSVCCVSARNTSDMEAGMVARSRGRRSGGEAPGRALWP